MIAALGGSYAFFSGKSENPNVPLPNPTAPPAPQTAGTGTVLPPKMGSVPISPQTAGTGAIPKLVFDANVPAADQKIIENAYAEYQQRMGGYAEVSYTTIPISYGPTGGGELGIANRSIEEIDNQVTRIVGCSIIIDNQRLSGQKKMKKTAFHELGHCDISVPQNLPDGSFASGLGKGSGGAVNIGSLEEAGATLVEMYTDADYDPDRREVDSSGFVTNGVKSERIPNGIRISTHGYNDIFVLLERMLSEKGISPKELGDYKRRSDLVGLSERLMGKKYSGVSAVDALLSIFRPLHDDPGEGGTKDQNLNATSATQWALYKRLTGNS